MPKSARKEFAFTVCSTGLITGEAAFIPRQASWKGSRLVLEHGTIPPSFGDYDQWCQLNPDGGDHAFFLGLYQRVCHRPGMTTVDAVRAWFMQAAQRKLGAHSYLSMSLVPDVRVRIEALDGDQARDPTVISGENMEQLLSESLTPVQALELFEQASAAEADASIHQRRLLFRLDYWQLDSVELPEQMPAEAPVLLLADSGSVSRAVVGAFEMDQRSRLVRLRTETALVYVSRPGTGDAELDKLAFVRHQLHGDEPDYTAAAALAAVAPLSLSLCKSLLQKLVRTGADAVQALGVKTDDGDESPVLPARVLLAAVVAHMVGLAMFNPMGGGRELGTTALFKRAAVIALEDAWPAELPDAEERLEWLAVCAADRAYRPSAKALQTCYDWLDACRRSRHCTDYKSTRQLPPLAELPADSSLGRVRYLFEHFIHGMPGDINMVAWLHTHGLGVHAAPTEARLVEIPIYHFLDHHCAPGFVYLLPPGGVTAALIDTTYHAFAPVFSRVFSLISGVNPRRVTPEGYGRGTDLATLVTHTDVDAELIAEVTRAQRTLWLSMFVERKHTKIRSTLSTAITLRTAFDRLAYEVGVHKIRYNGIDFVWTLGTQDSCEISVARARESAATIVRPVESAPAADEPPATGTKKRSRARADLSATSTPKRLVGELTEEEREAEHTAVQQLVLDQLATTGVQCRRGLVKVRADLSGIDLITVNDVPWDTARSYTLTVPCTTWGDGTEPSDSLMTPRMSIDTANTAAFLGAYILRLPGVTAAGRALALSMMRSPATHLAFPRPSRDGGASRDAAGAQPSRVYLEAWTVCKAISDVSALLLCPRQGNDLSIFDTHPRYLDLRIDVATRLSSQAWATVKSERTDRLCLDTFQWFQSLLPKTVYLHQQRAVRMLAYRVVEGLHRAHFLWMDMGSGKTVTALLFAVLLQFLRQSPLEQTRCVFVTTPSAVESVGRDILALGLRGMLLGSCRNRVAELRDPSEFNVVLATHDIVKTPDVMEWLAPYAATALVVIDEVHQCTGGATQRGAAIQLLASLAGQVLFMTATPLRSMRDKRQLCSLLQHVANFPCVTDKDFIVACNAMVHPQVCSRVQSEHEVVSAESDDNRERLYRHIPPCLGGRSKETLFTTASFRLSLEAAHDVADEFIVRRVSAEIAAGRRPLVVCRSDTHVRTLADALRRGGMRDEQMFLGVDGTKFEPMTDDTLAGSPLVVALVCIRRSTGYSATYFNVRIRSVFPSNEADRAQMDGRVVREGQRVQPVRLITVHCGITSLILRRHLEAFNMVRLMDELNAVRLE